MSRPGEYSADSTEGITNPNDLPAPKKYYRSRIRKKCRWGLIADELGLKMTGKELFDGFLASTEYRQALNGLGVVFQGCKDFNAGKIGERQVEKIVKNTYAERVKMRRIRFPNFQKFSIHLPGKDSNLERGNQNPLCCQLHHQVIRPILAEISSASRDRNVLTSSKLNM